MRVHYLKCGTDCPLGGPLFDGFASLLPAFEGDADGPVSGVVFKIERGPAAEKVAYVRMRSGTMRTRERVRFGDDGEAKVTGIDVFDRGSAETRAAVSAGEISEGAWYVLDADPEDALCSQPGGLWRFVLQRQGGKLALVANFPSDPNMN